MLSETKVTFSTSWFTNLCERSKLTFGAGFLQNTPHPSSLSKVDNVPWVVYGDYFVVAVSFGKIRVGDLLLKSE